MTATVVSDELADSTAPVAAEGRHRSRFGRARLMSWLILAVATGLWLASLPKAASAPLSEWGLLAAGSPLFLTSMLVTVIGFVVAVRRSQPRAALAATFVMAAQMRLTITLATAVPYYSWTYKHLAVVDYIEQHNSIARDVDLYQNWPGLFASTAWFSRITGLDPMSIAHWFTPVLHVAMIMLSIAMARAWGADRMTSIVAAFIMETLNWVGQDYFSPQATAFLLGMGVLTLLGHSRHKPVALPLTLLLFTALTVTHQLTPYWLILAALLLAWRGEVKPRWLPIAFIGIAGLFLLLNWKSAGHYSLLSFNPLANAQSNIPTVGVFGQRVTSAMVRSLAVGIWVLGTFAAFRQRRTVGVPALPLFFIGFSSFLLLAGQGYGGEAIFRVFLYSLPGTALLLAGPLRRIVTMRWYATTPATGVMLVVTLFAAQGVFGSWSAYRMTKQEVSVSTALLNQAPLPAYITPTALVWPERNSARYTEFARWNPEFDQTMVAYAQLVGSNFNTDADYAKFEKAVATRTDGPTYLIITQQMRAYGWYFGGLPLTALTNLADRLTADPTWALVYTDARSGIFIYESRTDNGPVKTK